MILHHLVTLGCTENLTKSVRINSDLRLALGVDARLGEEAVEEGWGDPGF